jgi:hypothetical protein
MGLKRSGQRASTDDSGRHLTMLPSRGLRPAQFVPLSSRQSTVLRCSASRKVRNIQSATMFARPISALTSACRTSILDHGHMRSQRRPGILSRRIICYALIINMNVFSSRPFPEPPAFPHRHVEQARSSQSGGEQAQPETRISC